VAGTELLEVVMADLGAFRDRVHELYRKVALYDGHKPTQADLAEAVGVSRVELNRRLNGYRDARPSPQDVRAIVRALAEWGGIQTRAEAFELLNLLDCPPFTPAEWASPPLYQLAANTVGLPVTTAQEKARAVHLPSPATSFIGREHELVKITALLRDTHLLTLTGAGGTGKTRLALATAQHLSGSFPDGLYQVELASLSSGHSLAALLAATFSLSEQGEQTMLTTLIRYLHDKHLLLILDNCEHLVAEVAGLTHHLLINCPQLVILTTSRETLRVEGERVYLVPPLSLPTTEDALTTEQLLDYEAIRLFIARGKAVDRQFELTSDNARAVRQVCGHLDGLPLAIELAAARLAVLSVEQILELLTDRFRLLTSGSRHALPRQQNLKALIDWSYNLLPEEEQVTFLEVAIFPGSFSLAAAQSITNDDDKYLLLDHLANLVAKSLVVKEGQAADSRYRMLETIRQYAQGQTTAALASQAAVRTRYVTYYLDFAERASHALIGPEQTRWLHLLNAEYDNLRLAVDIALAAANDEAALSIAATLGQFWWARGYLSEGRTLLEAVLAQTKRTATAQRAQALKGVGALAVGQLDMVAARKLLGESLEIYKVLGDEGGAAKALNNLAMVEARQGDYQAAELLYVESLRLKRKLGDPHAIAIGLLNLGMVAYLRADFSLAQDLLQQAIPLLHDSGDQQALADCYSGLGDIMYALAQWGEAYQFYQRALVSKKEFNDPIGIAGECCNIAMVLIQQGSYAEAKELLNRGLASLHQMSEYEGLIFGLEGLALLALHQGQVLWAVRLYSVAATTRRKFGIPLPPPLQPSQNHYIDRLQAELGQEAFAAEWAVSSHLPLDEVVAAALDQPGD